MFWNDPHMYGVTLPFKDIPTQMQTPINPWHQVPRFLPQTPFVPQGINYLPQTPFVPQNLGFAPTNFDVRTMPVDPYLYYQRLNLPFYGCYRPYF